MKGGILIFVALVIGVLLLNQGSGNGEAATSPTTPDASGDTTPATTDGDTTDGTSSSTANTTTSAPDSRPPEEVTVLVANGSGIAGAAGEVTGQLAALGYLTAAESSASAPVTTTTVYYIAGFEAEAAAVAEDLGLAPADAVGGEVPTPVPTQDGSMRGANVLVILGPDVAPTSSGDDTTTTAGGTDTTAVVG